MATQAQLNASKKYQDKLDRVVFYLEKGKKDRIKAHAESMGMSLNAYINDLIDKDMGK
jgi:predicted DNA binding CopG/RHH family protein